MADLRDPVIDHVDIRVSDREASLRFYDAVLAVLGKRYIVEADWIDWGNFSIVSKYGSPADSDFTSATHREIDGKSEHNITTTNVPVAAASPGHTGLRYDATANEYVFNWSTTKTPGCYGGEQSGMSGVAMGRSHAARQLLELSDGPR